MVAVNGGIVCRLGEGAKVGWLKPRVPEAGPIDRVEERVLLERWGGVGEVGES